MSPHCLEMKKRQRESHSATQKLRSRSSSRIDWTARLSDANAASIHAVGELAAFRFSRLSRPKMGEGAIGFCGFGREGSTLTTTKPRWRCAGVARARRLWSSEKVRGGGRRSR